MKFINSAILLIIFHFAVNAQQITVYLAGDSTMATKSAAARPEAGWGEYLQGNFDEKKAKFENFAQNGRSSKSFIDEGRWQKIVDSLKEGDYVFIQFGHNDEKNEDPKRYTPPNGEYRENLIKFVKDVRGKKATPVLLTPVMRRRFNKKGEFYDTHGEYPDAVRKVAAELGVALIDLHRKTETLIKNAGVEGSKKIFLFLKEGESPNRPKALEDNTHFSAYGAEQIALLAIEGIRELKLGLAKLIKTKSDKTRNLGMYLFSF